MNPSIKSLYELHADSLHVFVYRFVKNREKAEEILQEVFIRAMHQPAAPTKGWLYTVARNLALNFIRDEKLRYEKTIPENDAPDGEDLILNQRWLQIEINELSPTMREIYQLRSEGLSYEQMAERLGIPLGTVKSRIHEMVKTLQTRWRQWNVN